MGIELWTLFGLTLVIDGAGAEVKVAVPPDEDADLVLVVVVVGLAATELVRLLTRPSSLALTAGATGLGFVTS